MLKKIYSILLGLLILPNISTAMETEKYHNRAVAFLMSQHPRLGEASPAKNLPPEVIRTIIWYAQPRTILLKNEFSNAYFNTNPLTEVLFFRIRDITTGKQFNAPNLPVIWEGHLAARDNTTLEGVSNVLNTNQQIRISEDTARIRIAVVVKLICLYDDYARGNPFYISENNIRDLKSIVAKGEIGAISSNLRIEFAYNNSPTRQWAILGN